MTTAQYSPQTLKDLQPTKEFFIGIDSDGCVFDSMELKQKECFVPNTIRVFGLQSISKYVREVSEFVNLYSMWRGANRFPDLIKVMDLLAERSEVKARGIQVPRLDSLRAWMAGTTRHSNSSLQEKIDQTGDDELKQVMEWSLAVNRAIEEMVFGLTPFPFVIEFLERAGTRADLLCISQTPAEALEREWQEHGIDKYVRLIAGQEYGTKTEHLQLAAGGGKYPRERKLMIGDALGDLKAAREGDTLFFPINPGGEEASWEQLAGEGLDRFFDGSFAGAYEEALIENFRKLLPETPSWSTD